MIANHNFNKQQRITECTEGETMRVSFTVTNPADNKEQMKLGKQFCY